MSTPVSLTTKCLHFSHRSVLLHFTKVRFHINIIFCFEASLYSNRIKFSYQNISIIPKSIIFQTRIYFHTIILYSYIIFQIDIYIHTEYTSFQTISVIPNQITFEPIHIQIGYIYYHIYSFQFLKSPFIFT